MELSPEDIRKDKNKVIPAEFLVYLTFEDVFIDSNPYETEIEDLSPQCQETIGEATLNEWRTAKEIIANHDFPDEARARQMLPNVDENLLQSRLVSQL